MLILHACFLALLMACSVDAQAVAYSMNVTLSDGTGGESSTNLLTLYYNNLLYWKEDVKRFVLRWQLETAAQVQEAVNEVSSIVENYLTLRNYPPEMVAGDGVGKLPEEFADNPMSCSQALVSLVQSVYSFAGRPHYDMNSRYSSGVDEYDAFVSDLAATEEGESAPILLSLGNTRLAQYFARWENPVKVIGSVIERYKPSPTTTASATADTESGGSSRYPALFGSRGRELHTTFIVYQTRFANTGGTTALRILHELLTELFAGPNAVLLCDERNHMSSECASPPSSAVVITGEWCHEVLHDHGIDYHHGRGIQYHLGFHHYRDICAGHIAMADSQYLHSYLGSRLLSAYFLSCPMTQTVERAFAGLLRYSGGPEDVPTHSRGIAKENLVIIDPDYSREYRPNTPINIKLPPGVRVVFAENIPHHEMPLLLQRAKVVVDLAVPGPERLIGEGVMSGAIPIISNRWNGASVIDFPGVTRVDATNATNISQAIITALNNFPNQVNLPKNGEFLKYILSLRERAGNTVEIIAGSASLHFLLSPRTADEERQAVFQIVALLHIFPLASIDLLVEDPVWFIRHNYPIVTVLREAGYMREDPMEPLEAQQVSVSGAVTSGSGSGQPASWGKSKGKSWAQAPSRHAEELENQAHVSIKSRTAVASAIHEQASVSASLSLSSSEVVPGWGAAVVAMPIGVVMSEANTLLKAANTVMGVREGEGEGEERALHTSLGDIMIVSPRSLVSRVATSPWYGLVYGSTPPSAANTATTTTTGGASGGGSKDDDDDIPQSGLNIPPNGGASGGGIFEEKAVRYVDNLLECPSLHGAKAEKEKSVGEGKEPGVTIAIVDGVTHSPAWRLLQSHYCNHL